MENCKHYNLWWIPERSDYEKGLDIFFCPECHEVIEFYKEKDPK